MGHKDSPAVRISLGPLPAVAGQPYTIGLLITDRNNNLANGSFDWGDGTIVVWKLPALAPTSLTHTYAHGGSYTLRATEEDKTFMRGSATASITVMPPTPIYVPPVLPPTPIPGSQRLLTMGDLTLLGTFKSPAYLAANGGSVTYPWFTLRRVGGVLKTLWLTADHGGNAPPNELIQVDYPGYGATLGTSPLAAANFRNFGNGWLTKAVGADGRILAGLSASGIHWDLTNNCLWVVYGDVYNTSGYKDPVLIRGDINDAAPDASAVTWSGPWRFTGSVVNSPATPDSHQTQSYVVSVPPAYGAAHLGGATLALGGSYSSGGAASPYNAVLWAPAATPTAGTPTQPNGGPDLPATCLIGGDINIAHRGRRPGDYTTVNCPSAGVGDADPTSFTRSALTGYYGVFDSVGSAVWLDWDTVKGVLFLVSHGRGHIWYNNAGLQPPPPGRCNHGVNDRYSVTGPESVVPVGNDSLGVPYPANLRHTPPLAYETGPDSEIAFYAYDPETFVPVAGGDPWGVPVHDWTYLLDRFPGLAVCQGEGQFIIIKPTALAADETNRLIMVPCGYVTGGGLNGIGFYVNVFQVAP